MFFKIHLTEYNTHTHTHVCVCRFVEKLFRDPQINGFNLSYTENAKRIPAVEVSSAHKGIELSGTPIELKGGDWAIKVVPWIGGRIISMTHLPSGRTFYIMAIFLFCSFPCLHYVYIRPDIYT